MNDDHPDLSGLLRGDLGNAEALEVAAHAKGCGTCRDDLVDLSLGHALLTAAVRRAGVSTPAEVSSEAHQGPKPLPAELRAEIRRRQRRRPVLVAAAAAVAVAALSAALLLPGDDSTPPAARPSPTPTTPARTTGPQQVAALEPVAGAAGAAGGQVAMDTDRQRVTRMRVDTVDLPHAARGEFYYVWLLDPATNKMLPLGQVAPGHRASFDVPESLVVAYSAIDISLESDDGDPGHSVTSVLRASYSPSAVAATSPTSGS